MKKNVQLVKRWKVLSLILIALVGINFTISAQQIEEVTGRVTDEQNNPLQGVTVVIKGTNRGTTTDEKGDYSITISKGNNTLVFSYVGLNSQEISIQGESSINVKLQANPASLTSIVVVGYGTQSRSDVTTSISKLDNRVLEDVPYSNVTSALEGTIPGLRVQSTSGQPGSTPRVILRGGASINNPNGATPLYVVDGVIRSNLEGINPSDIKSIQVLKDAASAAIYGARGSNGVIVVVTKSGQPGKTQVNYKYNLSISKVGKTYDLLNARDFVYYARRGIAATASLNPAYEALLTGSTYAGGTGNDLTRNTYLSLQYLNPDNEYKLNEGWESMPDPLDSSKTLIFANNNYQDLLFRTAVSHKHSLSVSGGGENATFRLGLGYLTNEGIAIQTDYNQFSLNLDGTLKISKNIDIFSRVMYDNTNNKQVYSVGNIFKSALIQPPTDKLYLEDGTLSPGRSLAYSNPQYALSTYLPNNRMNNLTFIFGGRWEILPNFNFTPQLSYFRRTSYSRNFQKAFWDGVGTFNESRTASGSYSENESPQANAVFTYSNSFNNAHNLEVKAGVTYFGVNNRSVGATGSDAPTDLIPTLNASPTPVSVSGAESHQVLLGYFSRVTYNYKQKYLLNASIRYDGASNLGSDTKWGVFPGISAGWRLDQEEFWDELFPSKLLQLKLRGSYGVTGNISGLGLYQAQGNYSTSERYDGNGAIQISQLPNQNLKWEQSKTLDIGLDVGFLDQRISLMADYYRRKTSNLLTTLEMPPSTGISSIITNYGSLENKGFEIEVNANILPPSSQFQWSISFNAATVHSKILKLPPNGQKNNRVGGVFVYDRGSKGYTWKGGLQEGGRIGDLYGYKQVSIYATDKEAAEGPIDMLIPYDNKIKLGGDVNWLDVDRNDTIDTRDQVYMGNPYPTLTGGFSTLFSYKNLSLNLRMDYTRGATVYYETGARLEGNFSGSNALSNHLLRSWKKQGDITDVPRYYWADQNAHWNVWDGRGSSRFFQSTDFLCLREITLAYNIPMRVLERFKIAALRFNLTCNNLYYFTNYEGLNPEQTSSDVAYPIPRNFILGASITF